MSESIKKNPPDQRMAQRVKELREKFLLNQKDEAAIVGVTVRAVYGWETGTNRISPRHQRAIARVYDVSVAVVRGDEPIPELTKARQRRLEQLLAEAEARARKEPSDPARLAEGGHLSSGESVADVPA